MKQIIKIENDKVFIGTETNEIISTELSCIGYENPQVGDNVEVYKNGDTFLVIKADNIDSQSDTKNSSTNNVSIKKSGNKKWIFIGAGAVALIVIVIIAITGRGDTYKWSDSEMANMLPKPEGKITALTESEGDYLDVKVKIKEGYCKTYIDKCIDKGFDNDKDSYNSNDNYSYTALNDDGWELNIESYDDKMYIYLYSPEYLNDDYDNTDDTSDDDYDDTKSTKNDLIDGMRPEFKEAMDSYEDFYDEYFDFLNDYAENPTDSKLISKYSKLAAKALDMDNELEKWNDSEMNDTELKYYLKVTGNISQKLLELSDL